MLWRASRSSRVPDSSVFATSWAGSPPPRPSSAAAALNRPRSREISMSISAVWQPNCGRQVCEAIICRQRRLFRSHQPHSGTSSRSDYRAWAGNLSGLAGPHSSSEPESPRSAVSFSPSSRAFSSKSDPHAGRHRHASASEIACSRTDSDGLDRSVRLGKQVAELNSGDRTVHQGRPGLHQSRRGSLSTSRG